MSNILELQLENGAEEGEFVLTASSSGLGYLRQLSCWKRLGKTIKMNMLRISILIIDV